MEQQANDFGEKQETVILNEKSTVLLQQKFMTLKGQLKTVVKLGAIPLHHCGG